MVHVDCNNQLQTSSLLRTLHEESGCGSGVLCCGVLSWQHRLHLPALHWLLVPLNSNSMVIAREQKSRLTRPLCYSPALLFPSWCFSAHLCRPAPTTSCCSTCQPNHHRHVSCGEFATRLEGCQLNIIVVCCSLRPGKDTIMAAALALLAQ